MSCWNGFGRSLLFAFLCAGAAPFYLGVVQVVGGWKLAFATYLLLAAAVYLFGVARRPARGIAAAGATLLCGSTLLLLGASVSELALALAALIGLFRSGLLQPARHRNVHGFGRRFAVEAGLIGSGLALASYLFHGAPVSEASALWGFFLVQSAFFLIGDAAAPTRGDSGEPLEIDPFERACRRAHALLQQNS